MGYKKCPRCELNYIRDDEEYCEICLKELNKHSKQMVDNNKYMVEQDLLPILRQLPEDFIEACLTKETSKEYFGLEMPLLVRCGNKGKEYCSEEIKIAGHNRYYVTQYNIHGKLYHVCSQWWSVESNRSKDILKRLILLRGNYTK